MTLVTLKYIYLYNKTGEKIHCLKMRTQFFTNLLLKIFTAYLHEKNDKYMSFMSCNVTI